jgi:hypothetical protein
LIAADAEDNDSAATALLYCANDGWDQLGGIHFYC